MSGGAPRRVAIEARLPDGVAGGIQQVLLGLAHGLGTLGGGEGEEYLFLTTAEARAWLGPYLRGPCRPLAVPEGPGARLAAGVGRVARDPWTTWRSLPLLRRRVLPALPTSDGLVERSGAAVMHFPFQAAFRTRLPSIYHPHDLQHLHLPTLFSPREVALREYRYGAFCRRAALVAVASTWVKRDVERHFGLPDGRVEVVPLAPPTEAYAAPSRAELEAARGRFQLPGEFLFYPAQTWAHKNHLAVVEALALLRDRHGLRLTFVSSGRPNDAHAAIERRAAELDLSAQVRLLGWVDATALQCLYRLCRAVVIPSRFEAASFPLWEAQQAGVPVACSRVTSLPEQAAGSALLFDPEEPAELATALRRLWTDPALCADLVGRGLQRVAEFTWERTARAFRAHYRRLGGWPLSAEDRQVLSRPPIL